MKKPTKSSSKADSPFSLDGQSESDEYSDGGIDWDEAINSDLESAKPKKKQQTKAEPPAKPKAKPSSSAPERPALKEKESSSMFLTVADLGKQVRDAESALL